MLNIKHGLFQLSAGLVSVLAEKIVCQTAVAPCAAKGMHRKTAQDGDPFDNGLALCFICSREHTSQPVTLLNG